MNFEAQRTNFVIVRALYFAIFVYAFHISVTQADNIRFSAPDAPVKMVRFAVISDLTGGERPGVFDVVIQGLSALQPDFVLTVGDLIEGGTEDVATMNSEWKNFSTRANKVGVPVYPVVGNHDVSNLAMRNWWRKNIGLRYYHFRYKDILFLMVDSEDFSDTRFSEIRKIRDEGIAVYKQDPSKFPDTEYAKLPERKYGQIREEQNLYFEEVIQTNTDVRWTFVLMHKPVWKGLEPQGLDRIETALSGRDYTVMNGHTHTYLHTQRLGQDYIQLGTTGGAFTPADDGEYLDHIMWVSISEEKPKYLNITLSGMRNIEGKIPYTGARPCFAQEECWVNYRK
jgi:3',5'-cyclic AMP phosphodiesterase CpdA